VPDEAGRRRVFLARAACAEGMMEAGVVGKPNVGKSTFFAAATLQNVQIANYPFTTIKPNRGAAYVRAPCPHTVLGRPCNPVNSACDGGTRLIPVELIDVAGLVKGAHTGRGQGNQFLDDLRQAAVLVHVVDAAGATDADGNMAPPGSHDPVEDLRFLEEEVHHWLAAVLSKGWERTHRLIELEGKKTEEAVHEKVAGLGFTRNQTIAALRECALPAKPSAWKEGEFLKLAGALQRLGKPIIVAANKCDLVSKDAVERLKEAYGPEVFPVAAEMELALRRADKAGVLRYTVGAATFETKDPGKLSPAQAKALDRIRDFLVKWQTTGVQRILEHAVFERLKLIPVYPVEDEGKWTDKDGNVLPHAHLVPEGATARDLAYKVHTDLGQHFIRGIDAKTRRVVGADHKLQAGDVVKIVAAK
jgi:ribosome-binding ATPase YchF (GTP1/OBG family)